MQKEEQRYTADSSILEGMTSIRALIKSADGKGASRIEKVLYDKNKAAKKGKEIAWLNRYAELYGFSLSAVPEDEIDRLTTGNSHGGIIAYAKLREIPALTPDCIENDGFFVMMEGIEDPYNFGYAIRSMYAFGVTGIVLPRRNWMSAQGIVARASAGASLLIPAFTCDGCEAARMFREKGYKVVCTGKDADTSLREERISFPVFLIVGGEKRGISAQLRELADMEVKIEYGRNFGASLSAASAATVLAYEISSQRRLAHVE